MRVIDQEKIIDMHYKFLDSYQKKVMLLQISFKILSLRFFLLLFLIYSFARYYLGCLLKWELGDYMNIYRDKLCEESAAESLPYFQHMSEKGNTSCQCFFFLLFFMRTNNVLRTLFGKFCSEKCMIVGTPFL